MLARASFSFAAFADGLGGVGYFGAGVIVDEAAARGDGSGWWIRIRIRLDMGTRLQTSTKARGNGKL